MYSVGRILDISKQVEKVFGVWVCLEKFFLKTRTWGRDSLPCDYPNSNLGRKEA